MPRATSLAHFAVRCLLVLCVLSSSTARAQSQEVVFAGFAYSGDVATREARFPFSTRYEKGLASDGQAAYKRILMLIERNPPRAFKLSAGIDNLKGRDQAIVS